MLGVTKIIIKKQITGALTVWSIKDLFIVWQKDLADFSENQ